MPGQDGKEDEVENTQKKLEYVKAVENISNWNEIVSQTKFSVIHFKTQQEEVAKVIHP